MTEFEKELVGALNNIASALRALGNNDAATSMGAIENLSKTIQETFSIGFDRTANALSDVGEQLHTIARTFETNSQEEN